MIRSPPVLRQRRSRHGNRPGSRRQMLLTDSALPVSASKCVPGPGNGRIVMWSKWWGGAVADGVHVAVRHRDDVIKNSRSAGRCTRGTSSRNRRLSGAQCTPVFAEPAQDGVAESVSTNVEPDGQSEAVTILAVLTS